MTEYFRITGLNTIPFDSEVTGHADHRYRLVRGESPKGIDEPLTKEQAIPHLRNLPTEIASHIQGRPGEHVMSIITFPFSIQGADDADMEAAEHDLRETLEDGKLYIATKGARGTRAVIEMKSDEAVNMSYHTIFWGEFTEDAGREILGAAIKESYIRSLQMRLFCEAYWRPEEAVTLGPNEIYCPSFEEDGNADGEADNWDARGASVLSMESTIVLHGCYSQQVDTDAANEGIESTAFAKAAAETDAVAYAWICRPAAGSDIRVIMRDTTNNVDRDTALLSTGGWDEADAKDGVNTFYRLEVSSDSLPAGAANYELWIESTTDTETTFYVDKCFWLWGTTTAPDEWADHWLVYNHQDTDEGHQNYFDIDDLKGDVDGPVRLTATVPATSTNNAIKYLRLFRRSRAEVGNYQTMYEAELRTGATAWPNIADGECSNGNKVLQGAGATTGNIFWVQTVNIDDLRGRIQIYARVRVTDYTNDRFRASIFIGTSAQAIYTQWIYPIQNNEWQLIDLGNFQLPQSELPAGRISQFNIQLWYIKVDGDTVECDFMQLMPVDEPDMRIDIRGTATIGTADYYIQNDGAGITNSGIGYGGSFDATDDLFEYIIVYGRMLLAPTVENRLLYHFLAYYLDRMYIYNNAGEITRSIISVDYLPQFVSPLE